MDKKIITVTEEEHTLLGYAWTGEKPAVGHVLIVSGMEEYAGRYDRLALFLVEHDFDVYSLDFFGQGLNVEEGKQSLGRVPRGAFEIYLTALLGLIARLRQSDKKPVYIIAHSMGSFITQRLIQLPGADVAGVVLSGTNGPDASFGAGAMLSALLVNKKNWDKKAVFFNNLAFGGYAKAVPHAKTAFDWLSYNEENVKNYIADLYCGFGSSNGFYHEFMHFLPEMHKNKHVEAIDKELPILLVAGEEDPVGHCGKGIHKLERLYHRHGLKYVSTIIYPHMRHEIFNEKDYEKVYKDVVNFLQKI